MSRRVGARLWALVTHQGRPGCLFFLGPSSQHQGHGQERSGGGQHLTMTGLFILFLALTTCYRAAASGMRSLSLKWYPLACNEGGQICRNVYRTRVPGSRALGTTRLTPQKEPGMSWGDGPHPLPNPHGHLNRDLSLARSSQHRHHQGLLC